jgi:lipopolysaccharide transport system permease protein
MRQFFLDTWKSRYLVTTWARYNIEANYLDTKLGALWIVLQPLIETLVYAAVFSLILARRPRGDAPFVLFFLSGMILWQLFSGAMMKSSTIMHAKINTISQIKFPTQALIFVDLFEKLVDFVVTFVILIILCAVFGFSPTVAYVYLPLVLLVFFTFTIGAMFVFSTLGAFIQDISQIMGVALRFMMYFSGVLISADMIPQRFAAYLNFNPLFFMIESFRNIVLYAEAPDFGLLLLWFIFSIVFLFAGILFFKAYNGLFADYQ